MGIFMNFPRSQRGMTIDGFVVLKKDHVLKIWKKQPSRKQVLLTSCTWNPKQPFINRCLVISNHFLCKDWESSNWNNHLQMVGLGVPGRFTTYLFATNTWNASSHPPESTPTLWKIPWELAFLSVFLVGNFRMFHWGPGWLFWVAHSSTWGT